MKYIIAIMTAIIGALLAWRVGGLLSSDAVAMALGVLFGMLAGLPVALLVVASQRRRDEQDRQDRATAYDPRDRQMIEYMKERAQRSANYTRMDAEFDAMYGEWRVVDHA